MTEIEIELPESEHKIGEPDRIHDYESYRAMHGDTDPILPITREGLLIAVGVSIAAWVLILNIGKWILTTFMKGI